MANLKKKIITLFISFNLSFQIKKKKNAYMLFQNFEMIFFNLGITLIVIVEGVLHEQKREKLIENKR